MGCTSQLASNESECFAVASVTALFLTGRRIGDAGRFGQSRTKKEVSRARIKNFGSKRIAHDLLLLRR
jgi:hypothetical protein